MPIYVLLAMVEAPVLFDQVGKVDYAGGPEVAPVGAVPLCKPIQSSDG